MKRFILLPFLLLAAAAPAAAQDFTGQQKQALDSCEKNISQKIYAPAEADKCLAALHDNGDDLLTKLRAEDESRATYILTYELSISDLGEFYANAEEPYTIQKGLMVRLERKPCPLCRLEMGPQPEKLFPWISHYAADKLEDTKKAADSWATLAPVTAAEFAKIGSGESEWAQYTITQRENALKALAQTVYGELLPPGAARIDIDNLHAHQDAMNAVWPYFTDEQREKILADIEGIKAEVDKAKAAAASPESAAKANALEKKYAAVQAHLPNVPGAGSSAFLNKTFDNTSGGGGALPKDGTSPQGANGGASAKTPVYTLTDKQAEDLSPRMQQALLGPKGELSDTPIGRDAIAFSKTPGGALKFSVEKLEDDNTRGVFNSEDITVKINKTDVEAYMKKYKVTAAELMDEKNTAALQKVTRYVAPVFIHEYDGHQEQTDWANKNNIPDHYYLGQEREAFSKGSLFVLQKREAELKKGNIGYEGQVSESDVNMANLLRAKGMEGVNKDIMYYKVPTEKGVAAQNFATYEELKKELTLRQIAAAKDPAAQAALDAKRPEDDNTSALQKKFNAIYPWYIQSVKKTAAEQKYFDDALAALDSGNGSLHGSAVPAPQSN
jgi:hypothetical protein